MIDISKISGNQIDRASVLHSSGVGRSNQGLRFGSTSSETFSTRQQTEANRAHIGSYKSANVHSDHRAPLRPFSSGRRADIVQNPRRTSLGSGSPHGVFSDTSRHRFDPYSG